MTVLASARITLAETFYDSIAGGEANYYFFLGRPQPWTDEQNPPTVVDTLPYLNGVRNDFALLKKIQSSDCKFMVPRREWTTATVYDQYDDSYGDSVTYTPSGITSNTLDGTFVLADFGEGWLVEGDDIPAGTHVLSATTTGILLDDTPTGASEVTITNVATSDIDNLKDSEFFVLAANDQVYKCLDNNGGANSTVEPTLVQIEPFEGGDGYRWKYMYTAPLSFMDEFGTVTHIPVDDGLDGGDLGIHAIRVEHGGTLYAGGTTTAAITGDGTGATADVVVSGGAVTGITVTDAGQGYTFASVIITDTATGTLATARAILSPTGGHGSNPSRELHSTSLRLSKELDASSPTELNNGFDIGNDYRQSGIIKDPLGFASSSEYTDSLGSACWVISGPFTFGDVDEDDIVTTTDGDRFRVVSKPDSDPGDPVDLLVQSLDGISPTVGMTIEYDVTNCALVEVTPPDIDKYTGMLFLVDNREAYAPTDSQLISFKSTVSF